MRANQTELGMLKALFADGYITMYYKNKYIRDDVAIQAAINIVGDLTPVGFTLIRMHRDNGLKLSVLNLRNEHANSKTLESLKYYLTK